MKKKACKRWGRGKKIGEEGGRGFGIRPKRAYLVVPTDCRDYVSSFHGIIHWTWWIVIFFHFSSFFFFNLLTSILILHVFFVFFSDFSPLFDIINQPHNEGTRNNTQHRRVGQASTPARILCARKKKNCTQKESEAFHRNSFSKTCTSLKVINLDDLESGRKKC